MTTVTVSAQTSWAIAEGASQSAEYVHCPRTRIVRPSVENAHPLLGACEARLRVATDPFSTTELSIHGCGRWASATDDQASSVLATSRKRVRRVALSVWGKYRLGV